MPNDHDRGEAEQNRQPPTAAAAARAADAPEPARPRDGPDRRDFLLAGSAAALGLALPAGPVALARQPDPKDMDPNPYGPFLFIPYYPGDVGSRPLPATTPFWECPGIKLDGLTRSAHPPLVRGQVVNLTATVANLGSAGALARVTFLWGDPATGFTAQTLHPIGTLTEYRAAGQTADTQPLPWVPPQNVPAHSCLVVEVSTPLDPAPGTYSPTDRHYAQQNLAFVVPGTGGAARVRFRAANPWPKPRAFGLRVRPMPDPQVRLIRKRLQGTPVPLDAAEVRISADGLAPRPGPVRFELKPQEARPCEVLFQPASPCRKTGFWRASWNRPTPPPATWSSGPWAWWCRPGRDEHGRGGGFDNSEAVGPDPTRRLTAPLRAAMLGTVARRLLRGGTSG
jgi:hypothetical protein